MIQNVQNGLERAIEKAKSKVPDNKALNKIIKGYLALVEEKKALEKAVKASKETLMGYDGLSTDKFSINVNVTPTERVVSKSVLIEKLGEEAVREYGLTKPGERKDLNINAK